MAREGSFYSANSKIFSVSLGDVSLYADKWEISSQRIFTEQASVTGESIVTNLSNRCSKIHLEGIWVTDEKPRQLMMTLDSFISENASFPLVLRELVFEDCRLLKYSLSEKGEEPFIKISIDLISCASPKEEENAEE